MFFFNKILTALLLVFSTIINAQFLDDFDKDKIEGWFFFTGDGDATMDFIQMNGYSRMIVDATKDKHNVYWTLIKRDISSFLDLSKFANPSFELRVEAKVRLSVAPRRINFMINTQRTTDFHEHLMEFDIPDTSDWHVVSYTTKNLDVIPGDTLYVQLCATDFGLDKYTVDIDYYRADIIDVNTAEPDKGILVPYHPPVPDVNIFSHHLSVSNDCMINSDFPNVVFNDWGINEDEKRIPTLTVNNNQWIILKWDFEKFKNMKVENAGLLELTTHSVQNGGDYVKTFGEDLGIEFGKVRIIEIIGENIDWTQEAITYNSFMQGKNYSEVFNTQMIFDAGLSGKQKDKNFITISKPVMQRLIDRRTKGLLIRPLGAIVPSFYSSESGDEYSPKLHFNSIE